MPINPSIALQLQVPDIAGSLRQGLDWHEKRQDKKRLADLLPQALGGGIGESGATSQSAQSQAIAQLYAVDPQLAMRLDDRQRKQASDLTSDLAAAVRWAKTPEDWQYIQQHYGQKGIDLSPYRFEDREKGLAALGAFDEYLKSAPKNEATSMERNYEFLNGKDPELANQYLRGQAEGSPIIQRNDDGTMTVYPRSMIGGSGYSPPPPPPPGFVIDNDGGPSPSGSGGFL
jgi:hypothetical protein